MSIFKNIRLGLLHVSVAITFVLINGVLNRVMIHDLNILASLVAVPIAMFFGFSVVGALAAGLYALVHLPLDAIPDLSDPQVVVFTDDKDELLHAVERSDERLAGSELVNGLDETTQRIIREQSERSTREAKPIVVERGIERKEYGYER